MNAELSHPGSTEQLFKLDHAAQILAVSRPTLYQLMANGRLAFVVIGRTRRISLGAIRRFIAESQTVGK